MQLWPLVPTNTSLIPQLSDNCGPQVPMGQVTLESMESLLLRYKGRYTAVVGFKPTGWSHPGGSGRGGQGGGSSSGTTSSSAAAAAAGGLSRSSLSIKPNRRRSQRGTVVLYQVRRSRLLHCGGDGSVGAQCGLVGLRESFYSRHCLTQPAKASTPDCCPA